MSPGSKHITTACPGDTAISLPATIADENSCTNEVAVGVFSRFRVVPHAANSHADSNNALHINKKCRDTLKHIILSLLDQH